MKKSNNKRHKIVQIMREKYGIHNSVAWSIMKLVYEQDKEFIKELRMFIKDKTMIASSNEGTNVTLIRFFPFEFEEFIKQKGDLE